MKHRSLAVALLLVAACKDSKPAEPAPKAEPTPTPTPTPAAEPAKVSYDCAAYLTAADVKEVCGADVAIEKGAMEGQYAITTCLRTVPRVQLLEPLMFKLQATSPEGAKGMVSLEVGEPNPEEKSRTVEVGDLGRLINDVQLDNPTQSLLFARNSAYVELVSPTKKGGKPLCSDDQLIELGKRLAGRLP